MTSRFHVKLLTYRRPKLLRRALDSVVAQTVADWECEVQNDDPSDPEPRRIVEQLGDPRVSYWEPEERRGALRAYNHAYRDTRGEYAIILHDDNWWEPRLLEALAEAFDADRSRNIVACNLALWREQGDASWRREPGALWEGVPDLFLIDWPAPQHLLSTFESDAALAWRSGSGAIPILPDHWPFSPGELVRSRMYDYPLLCVGKPLVNYSTTIDSTRTDEERLVWASLQAMLAASFLGSARLGEQSLREFMTSIRSRPYFACGVLANACLLDRRARWIAKELTAVEWCRAILAMIRRPRVAWMICKPAGSMRDMWKLLSESTSDQVSRSPRASGSGRKTINFSSIRPLEANDSPGAGR